jgi:hypothetical protein
MKTIGLLLACFSITAQAQVPHVVGTWQLDVAASRLPGSAPQIHVRRYSLTADGMLVGTAVVVDSHGRPSFLQFAAKPDGGDYPEFDTSTAAQYLIDGSTPARTYAERPIDSHTVEWVDKVHGEVVASGRKWVSADGQTLTFTVDAQNERGEAVQYLYVFDRTGP